MKAFLFAVAITILLIPFGYVLQGQDGGFGGDSIDVTGMLGGDRGGRGGGGNYNAGRGAILVPESKALFSDIQSALKKGKTPLDKSQEKPLRAMLDLEVVNLSDRIQVLRLNSANSNADSGNTGGRGGGNFPPGGGNFPPGGGFPGNPDFAGGGPPRGGNVPAGGNPPAAGVPATTNAANASGNNEMANMIAVQTETIAMLKNDDFIENKLSAFLSPEQVSLIQKVKKEDKQNATCLGGMLDRISPLNQNQNTGRGNRGNFNVNTNSTLKTNGQPFCMAADATASVRLEPIRKELAKANLPLAKDKEQFAEVFMKSQMKDLEDALRTTLTASFSGNRGGSSNSRSTNPQLVIQSGTDAIYKKAAAMLNPPQVESLKKWHYEQIQLRGGTEALIGIEAMQDTPLTEDQIARVTAAWPEIRNQLQAAAKAANKNLSAKDLDNNAMAKILDMLEPAQAASYQAAKKYGPAK